MGLKIIILFLLILFNNISYALDSEIGTVIEFRQNGLNYDVLLISKQNNSYHYIFASPNEYKYDDIEQKIMLGDSLDYMFSLVTYSQLVILNSYFGIISNLDMVLGDANIDINGLYWMAENIDNNIPAANIRTMSNNNLISKSERDTKLLKGLYYLNSNKSPTELSSTFNNIIVAPPRVEPIKIGEDKIPLFSTNTLKVPIGGGVGANRGVLDIIDASGNIIKSFKYNRFYITKHGEPIFFINDILTVEDMEGDFFPTERFNVEFDVIDLDNISAPVNDLIDIVYTGNIILIEYDDGTREEISFDNFEFKNGELLIYAKTSN